MALYAALGRMSVSEEIPFSAQAVAAGYWEIFHDDDCGATLTPDGLCPKCGFYPDLQSKGARRTQMKSKQAVSATNSPEDVASAEAANAALEVLHPPTVEEVLRKYLAAAPMVHEVLGHPERYESWYKMSREVLGA
jgi:hypothetical protein